jgi:adenylate kinase
MQGPMQGRCIVVLGPPCSGKGTQCKRLAAKLGLIHFSTGDAFRDHVARDTELGRQARPFLERGCFVPDDLVINMIHSRLAEPDVLQHGCLLDGFPRTGDQAAELINHIHIEQIVHLKVPDPVLLGRARERRIDPATGDIYHLTLCPPPASLLPQLVARELDDDDSFRVRCSTHRANLLRVLPVFEATQRHIVQVNGLQETAAVTAAIEAALRTPPPLPAPPASAGGGAAPGPAGAPTCSVCLTEAADFLCAPCGHQCGCEACLRTIAATSGRCPICRTPVTAIQRVFRVGGAADDDDGGSHGGNGGVVPAEGVPPPLLLHGARVASPRDSGHPDIEETLDQGDGGVAADDEWPEEEEDEDEPGVDDAVAKPEITITPAVDLPTETGGAVSVVVHITPPEDCPRAAVDVCCVVDTSGSMQAMATYENEEGHQMHDGLCVLDLVKHSVRSIPVS